MGLIIKFINKKIKFFSFFILVYILFLNTFSTIVFAEPGITQVYVNPENQTVSSGEIFNISIDCVPGQPIKAFEFKLSFNATMLEAISVSEGNIFSGHTTFFNQGTIDNLNGRIATIYNLIIGQGQNVSSNGTFAKICFKAKNATGISYINIYDVNVTNESNYVPTYIVNGNVTIIPHIFSGITPSNNSAAVPINTHLLSVNIENLHGNPFYWEITTSPGIGSNSGDNQVNGTKTCNISGLSYQTTYTWYVRCKDLISDVWTNVSYVFTTASNYNPPGGGGGGGMPPPPEENNPPNKPLAPVGSIFIENDTLYEYQSLTYDINGDNIRYKIDWGDGSTSDWSEYLSSNTTFTMSHSWITVSSFEVKVLAQDEHGLNSSWSDPLMVMVLEKNETDERPTVDFETINDINTSNQTIIFDASYTFDPDDTIVNYTWDFGDGNLGYGLSVVHTYERSGTYIVTLTVVDEEGYSYNKSTILNIQGSPENPDIDGNNEPVAVFEFPIVYVGLVAILTVVIIFVVKYRVKIKDKISLFYMLKIRR